MLRILLVMVAFVIILIGLGHLTRDPYQDHIECSRDRSSWDTEGTDECMRERGWTEENIGEPLFDRPVEAAQEEQPLLPLDFEPDREDYGDS